MQVIGSRPFIDGPRPSGGFEVKARLPLIPAGALHL
jgi:hypothetical protein